MAAYDTRLLRIALRAFDQVRPSVERARARYAPERLGILIGTSTGGLDTTEAAYGRFRATQRHDGGFTLRRSHSFDALAVCFRKLLGATGPAYAVSTACTASAKALGSAQRLLRLGVCDAVLVLGVDALTETTVRGFQGLSVLSEEPTRPFSSERKGIHLGEGAAALLIENQGDGPAALLGIGESSDAHSMSAPHPEGAGAALAMRAALADAGVGAHEIDYLNAHGTGTALNDAAEARAILEVLGASVPVASTKRLTGHTLGACGAIEAALCVLSIVHGVLPESSGAAPVDETLGINVLRETKRTRVRHVLSNALAFGGNNVSVLLGAT